jgi:hypothetical protein
MAESRAEAATCASRNDAHVGVIDSTADLITEASFTVVDDLVEQAFSLFIRMGAEQTSPGFARRRPVVFGKS